MGRRPSYSDYEWPGVYIGVHAYKQKLMALRKAMKIHILIHTIIDVIYIRHFTRYDG